VLEGFLSAGYDVLVQMESDAAYEEGKASGFSRQIASVRRPWDRALRGHLTDAEPELGDVVSVDVVKAELVAAVSAVPARDHQRRRGRRFALCC
jgi:hypothetical protein